MIVQKYGGVTIESSEKLKNTAQRIRDDLKNHQKMVIVVSAMGSTTNNLIKLAKDISDRPNLRELDMLLTTGERISASLLTMALLDLGVRATSLTGSQSGIVTTEHHSNAMIVDIRPNRIHDLFKIYDVIVIAGFQGVSEITKNITTLGRGGSDTTAIALAAKLGAEACYILKEVYAIFSVDPKLAPQSKPLSEISFKQASHLTFWGANVLHHRSTKIAEQFKVPVYVGPAHDSLASGTWIKEENSSMFEKPIFYAITSFFRVLKISELKNPDISNALLKLHDEFRSFQIIEPQILLAQRNTERCEIYLTGPNEALDLAQKTFKNYGNWLIEVNPLSAITLHCRPSISIDLQNKLLNATIGISHDILDMVFSSESITLFVPQHMSQALIQNLYTTLIEPHNDD